MIFYPTTLLFEIRFTNSECRNIGIQEIQKYTLLHKYAVTNILFLLIRFGFFDWSFDGFDIAESFATFAFDFFAESGDNEGK